MRIPALVILVAGVLAYANSLASPFVLEDRRSIVENPQIRALWPLAIPLSPPDETPVARRPLVNLSFAVNYAISGLDVRGYRVTNLGIHLLCALVLFGSVRRALALADRASPLADRAFDIAAISALLWVVHPLNTEVVNYLSQRTTSLKALFYLLTFYCSLRALDDTRSVASASGSARTISRGGMWSAGAILACASGMASKESMVTAPILIVLFDRIFVFESLREAARHRGRLYAGLAGCWIVLAALMTSGARTTVGFDAGTTSWTYLLNQVSIIPAYLWLVFWPHDLVVDYGLPRPLGIADVAAPGVVLLILTTATLAALRYLPRAGFLGAAFFITLAPTSSIVPIVTEVGAERRMYLPLAAIVVLGVCALARAVASPDPRAGADALPATRRRAWIRVAAIASVCAVLATGTFLRNRDYHSSEVLASTLVERRPHGRAYFTLGHALFEAGRRDEALRYFKQSARDFPGARFVLGTELLADGDFDAGIRQLREYIELLPDHAAVPSARTMIAQALAAKGDLDGAIRELHLVLEHVPQHFEAHFRLGEYYMVQNRADDAVRHLENAARVRPRDAATLRRLGLALSAAGDHAAAVEFLGRAVAILPSDARTVDMLGAALARQGRLNEALAYFRRATELDPSYRSAQLNLEAAERLVGTSGNH